MLKGFFRGLDLLRRILVNLIFFGVLAAAVLVFVLGRSGSIGPEPGSLLVLPIEGELVEGPADVTPSIAGLTGIISHAPGATRLMDAVDALAAAADDDRIVGVVLDVSGLESAGLASSEALGRAIDRYREDSGRSVWVWGADFTQAQYAIAAHADRLYVHPMGEIRVKGLSGASLYWRDLLDELGIKAKVYKAGAFKSAPEAYERSGPSHEALEAQKSMLDPAWNAFGRRLEDARKLPKGAFNAWMQAIASSDSALLADPAGWVEAHGWVSAALDRGAYEKALEEAYGKPFDALSAIDYRDYLASIDSGIEGADIVIVTAEGAVSDEPAMGGIVASDFCALLDAAAAVKGVKAIVVRLNSPGGDAVASEVVRAKLASLRTDGIRIVVSMGDAAASGGYWISTAADRIVAEPLTLTGSIGVFSVVPNAEVLLERAGVGLGGYETTPTAGWGTFLRAPTRAEEALYKAGVARVDARFKAIVAEARGLSPEALERIAGGRVWLGTQALEHGLVDVIGGLEEAVREAERLAGLSETGEAIVLDPAPRGWRSMLGELIASGVRLAVPETWKHLESKGRWAVHVVRAGGAPFVWSPEAAADLR